MNKTQWQNLKKQGKLYLSIIFAIVLVYIQNAGAQMFDDELGGAAEQEVVEQKATNPQRLNDAQRNGFVPKRAVARQGAVSNANNSAKAPERSKTNNVSVRQVSESSNQNKEEKIYLYYRNFKVSRRINGRVSCNMRLYVYSTVPEKITNIAYRLKWPEIETSINFDNVQPNTPAYRDYALLGEGCYSMDTPPNIIVNRCRIKNRSQKYCSSIIQWTK